MDYSSSTSRYTNSNTNHLHDRCLYERHPRHDSAHRATRASTRDQVSGASDYLNELNDPLGLGSSVGTTSASFPSTALFSYPQVDVKGMSMSTPHTRPMQALEPPPEDGTVYLHLPQYGGFPNNSSWSHMQTYPSPYAAQDWTSFGPYNTPLPSNLTLSDLSPPNVTLPLPQDQWSFEPSLPSFTPVPVDDIQHASTSASSLEDSSSRIVTCQWGKTCGVELDDLTAAGIARHLKEYHVQEWDNRARGRCEWHGSPCTNSTMYYASFGKHIASVHLGATARPCEKCGETFARADTLDRHMKLYCRLRSK